MGIKKILLRPIDSKINLDDFSDESLYYILPTEDALVAKRRAYIHKKGFMKAIKFMTFDGLLKENTQLKNPDPIYSFYILKRILKKYFPEKEYFNDFAQVIFDFFNDIFIEGIDLSELKTCKDPFFVLLYGVIFELERFFNKKNMTLYRAYRESSYKYPIKTLVVDGFVDFRKWHFDIIEAISEYANIYVHLPFNYNEFKIIKDNVNILRKMGFEVELKEGTSLEEDLKAKNISLIKANNSFNNMIFSKLKESINKYGIGENQIIINDKKYMDILHAQETIEEVSFDMDRDPINPIIEEFKIYFDYLTDKNRQAIILRAGLHYLPICEEKDKIDEILNHNVFSSILDLENLLKGQMAIDPKDIPIFIEFLDLIKAEKIKEENTLDYYVNFINNSLDGITKILDDDYKILKDGRLYRQGRLTIDGIKNILVFLENFAGLYEKISFEEFIDIFSMYLDSVSIKNLRNYNGLRVSEVNRAYFAPKKGQIFLGYNKNKNFSSTNFIYNRDNNEDLKRIGLIKDFGQIDIIKLIYSICNSDESIFLLENEEYANSLNFIKTKAKLGIETFEDKYITSSLNENIGIKREDEGFLTDENIERLAKILENRNFSATDFDAYITCGKKFLLEKVFKIEEYEDQYKEIDYLKEGSIHHKILEEYFKNKNVFDENYLKNLIMMYTFPKCRKEEDLSFNNKVKFLRDFNRLKSLIIADTDDKRLFSDYEPKYFEKKFSFNIGPINIIGFIDRIDVKEDREILIDYKLSNSSVKQANEFKEFKAFQPIIYALARDREGKKIAAFYYKTIKNFENVPMYINKDYIEEIDGKKCYFTEDELMNLLRESVEKIKELYNKMLGGVFNEGTKCKDK